MPERANVRYTKLENGNWIIEATNNLPISVIRSSMKFVDNEGTKHEITKLLEPDGNPEAPFYFYVEAVTKD